jgi:superoxide dismutase, Cu-Zn family
MTKTIRTIMILVYLLPLSAVAEWPQASAEFVDADGTVIGQAELVQTATGTLIRIEIDGLAPGPKAIHIHSVGQCDDHCDGFTASGGHINPADNQHGLLNPEGHCAGDLPNFHVHDNGYAQAEFYTTAVSLDGSFGARILDDDGAALVIHENPDDYISQPIGGAGARLACAVIVAD